MSTIIIQNKESNESIKLQQQGIEQALEMKVKKLNKDRNLTMRQCRQLCDRIDILIVCFNDNAIKCEGEYFLRVSMGSDGMFKLTTEPRGL